MSVQLEAGLALHNHTVAELGGRVQEAALVGSVYILGEGEDVDVLVLSSQQWIPAEALGYERSLEQHYIDNRFQSYRRGDVNLLVTDSKAYFDAWRLAAEVCKRFQVRDKVQRIAVHEAIKGVCGR